MSAMESIRAQTAFMQAFFRERHFSPPGMHASRWGYRRLSFAMLLACCSIAEAGTIVNASLSCQIVPTSGSSNPIYTQTESVTQTSGDSVNQQQIDIAGLGCETPYGAVTFPPSALYVRSNINPSPGQLSGNAMEIGVSVTNTDVSQYYVRGSVSVQFVTQQTFVITGGAGTGFLEGTDYRFADSNAPATISFTGPFSNSGGFANPVNWTYPFVFDQPFTLSATGEITLPFSNLPAGAGFSIIDSTVDIVDQNGNPIPSAVVTAAPEPRSAVLAGAGLFLFWLIRRTLAQT